MRLDVEERRAVKHVNPSHMGIAPAAPEEGDDG
jgi:hypothetical protein